MGPSLPATRFVWLPAIRGLWADADELVCSWKRGYDVGGGNGCLLNLRLHTSGLDQGLPNFPVRAKNVSSRCIQWGRERA